MTSFHDLKSKNDKYVNLINTTHQKHSILSTLFKKLILDKSSKIHNYEYLLGFDSFKFQTNLIFLDFKHFKNVHDKILNQVYYELYNIYQIIYRDIYKTKDNSIKVIKELDNYVFTFQQIIDLHNKIIILVDLLKEKLKHQEKDIEVIKNKCEMGINIENIINTEKHIILVLNHSIETYDKYLQIFYKHNVMYLEKIIQKIEACNDEIDNEITLFKNMEKTNFDFSDKTHEPQDKSHENSANEIHNESKVENDEKSENNGDDSQEKNVNLTIE